MSFLRALSKKETRHLITLDNISKHYTLNNNKLNVLQGINLEITESDIFGIIGYSGAGKSTLLRLINYLEIPTTGNVIVNQVNLGKLNKTALLKARKNIGMIFQSFNLLNLKTVVQNIALPLEINKIPKKIQTSLIKDIIQLVGLEGKEQSYPFQLSGGQKQRVGIARALVCNPKILLCDEATSALDPETTKSILDLLLKIKQKTNITIVLITHEMEVIKYICNKIAVLDKGKIIETGAVLDIFNSPQQELTKKLVVRSMENNHKASLEKILQDFKSGHVIKLTFNEHSLKDPIISNLIKTFSVEISILEGLINYLDKKPIGTLVLHIETTENILSKIINYLNQHHIVVERIPHHVA